MSPFQTVSASLRYHFSSHRHRNTPLHPHVQPHHLNHHPKSLHYKFPHISIPTISLTPLCLIALLFIQNRLSLHLQHPPPFFDLQITPTTRACHIMSPRYVERETHRGLVILETMTIPWTTCRIGLTRKTTASDLLSASQWTRKALLPSPDHCTKQTRESTVPMFNRQVTDLPSLGHSLLCPRSLSSGVSVACLDTATRRTRCRRWKRQLLLARSLPSNGHNLRVLPTAALCLK